MALKLDMSKAYDRIKWVFLEEVLGRIGLEKELADEIKEAILHSVGLREARSYEKYLGLPSYVGKHKMAAFRPVLESIRSQMQNWTIKFLSQAGKEVLLKAIVQAIPTYCMSIFKLPKTILNAIK
ncbi:uncharacterized protein LOC122282866 [Carya illinoinensis]|uniref:uncharacterized protein LOC122282866 n=1 Tax=Carya illinoinensis TaxID=32201 RepID=UPI001C71E70D|nr:uncharacterized protein LOC122282866 [Carya illinoinensis]